MVKALRARQQESLDGGGITISATGARAQELQSRTCCIFYSNGLLALPAGWLSRQHLPLPRLSNRLWQAG